jgi:hypothetical protein
MKIGCDWVDCLDPVTILYAMMFCDRVKTSSSCEEIVHWQFFISGTELKICEFFTKLVKLLWKGMIC